GRAGCGCRCRPRFASPPICKRGTARSPDPRRSLWDWSCQRPGAALRGFPWTRTLAGAPGNQIPKLSPVPPRRWKESGLGIDLRLLRPSPPLGGESGHFFRHFLGKIPQLGAVVAEVVELPSAGLEAAGGGDVAPDELPVAVDDEGVVLMLHE